MKSTAFLTVCSLVICSACFCAEKNDTGASQPDTGASQPNVRQVQQTNYDAVISEIKELTKEQRNALEATHYCLEIAALIDQDIYPRKLDKFELERQFRKIASEAYNYENFQDGTIKLLEAVIERIKDLRISEGDHRLIDELYVQEKRNVWMRVLPQNMAVLISAEWKQLVANTVQTLVYSTFNYLKLRNEIEKNYEKDNWELDKKDIEYDTEFIKGKLNVLYDICRNNKVKHVDEHDIKSLLKQFNENEAVINNVLTDDAWKPFNDCRSSYRTRDNENRYKMYSTYWYQRGYLAWIAYGINKIEEDRKEAMGCFKVYQELTNHQIVKYNPVAIDVAMMQIDLQPDGAKTDRDFLFNQLRIIRENLSPRSLDYQSVRFFCGQIYYSALKNYDNAAEMFKESEVAGNNMRTKEIDEFRKKLSDKTEAIEGSDEAVIGNFAVKDNNKKPPHFLPKLDAEFLARMAYYKSLIEAGKDIDAGNLNLVDKIYKDASWPYISPWEFLFYAAYVKEDATKKKYYEEILPKVLLKCEKFDCSEYFSLYPDWKSYPVGKQPLPYDLKYLSYTYNRWGKDSFYLELPYQYALLSGITFSMGLLCDGEVVTSVPCNNETMEKEGDNIFLCLEFPLNEKELIKRKIDGIRFDFKYNLQDGADSNKGFKSAITFNFGGVLTEGKASNWYKNLPGRITFELFGLDELEKGTPADVGARR